jgi:hypothetical protein
MTRRSLSGSLGDAERSSVALDSDLLIGVGVDRLATVVRLVAEETATTLWRGALKVAHAGLFDTWLSVIFRVRKRARDLPI